MNSKVYLDEKVRQAHSQDLQAQSMKAASPSGQDTITQR